ncbi:TetR/AcrR family transcriptional regulator C-terminal domain-containing protein [Streptomyces sp. NBC_00101]|uniref:TetR/AcrR family transcriptional regulator n=1 Tax=Streptomyces sp. NBC_00101 TaxID=2975651 RepID=UPI003253C0BF
MTTGPRRSQRRTEALSRERIVEASVELLDATGEGGLTFRALAQRLTTGPGALYHHVAHKDELLGAAVDAVVTAAVTVDPPGAAPLKGSPQDAVRAVATGLFDATEAHPWLAPQLAARLARGHGGTAAPRIFESLGRQVRAMGAPRESWFTVTSALMHYILGAAGQNAANAANARTLGPDASRARFLDAASTAWEGLDPDDYPFTRAVADQMRGHDDREQFLAGVDLVLAGIAASRPAAG